MGAELIDAKSRVSELEAVQISDKEVCRRLTDDMSDMSMF